MEYMVKTAKAKALSSKSADELGEEPAGAHLLGDIFELHTDECEVHTYGDIA